MGHTPFPDARNMSSICRAYVEQCRAHAEHMPSTCRAHVEHMPSICRAMSSTLGGCLSWMVSGDLGSSRHQIVNFCPFWPRLRHFLRELVFFLIISVFFDAFAASWASRIDRGSFQNPFGTSPSSGLDAGACPKKRSCLV